MTKYVLNSGGIGRYPDRKKRFHQEVARELSSLRFLICIFAQPRENWYLKYDKYCDSIVEDLSSPESATFDLAFPHTFNSQSQDADVIYFSGGDDNLLLYWMRQFDIPTLFDNKVVATNSVSSDMLSTYFWPCDWRECMSGLGILPIKFISHYRSDFGSHEPLGPVDWTKAYTELDGYGDRSLPIYALEEGEFVVFPTSAA